MKTALIVALITGYSKSVSAKTAGKPSRGNDEKAD
jgi:hypothetical protein